MPYKTIIPYLPESTLQAVSPLLKSDPAIEEIRLRTGQRIELSGPKPYVLSTCFSEQDRAAFVHKITKHSVYRLEEQLKRGYLTIEGGHRIGLAGQAVLKDGTVSSMTNLSFFNIRIAKQKKGAALPLLASLCEDGWKSTLLIGPPRSGKTTLLRDIARIAGTGEDKRNIKPVKTCIVDERSEIAGCLYGVPQLDVGMKTDVLDACPKSEGMMMMIRSMSPEVLIVDEIGRPEDAQALSEALHAGIAVIATVHARSLEEALRRPVIRHIKESGLFDTYIEVNREHGFTILKKERQAAG
ncbi:stage III sporulation protein AA [Domibacillus sp. DTU_2020_1001157_1_SI_ALB_TIR_016]|uniref:stage III sporulation protein AA n=1 Tax=Domibacillus sp. DTU_2020_1001157_1_SI_ALB_TIR_016 TaxID=3077789 RepID=UPI0028ED1EAB|nr:stage III sporulation protein AA [Domibacillus sp. DTU_2020_1001157_1_SI_ALB_TIR_016]WNS81984.1 stage III sporulation protein AA [Domibacillus sp. DTU_2020_1001157_1_SI_ALB_TIR_016]